MASTSSTKQMSLVESLEALHSMRRDDEVVVTAMGTAREWMALGSHPRDWIFVPSSMGQATALGLGIALAQPQRQVVICNGDGSTLMNLGSLVTITAEAPENLTLLIFDNGVYEVTGSQATPGAAISRRDKQNIDFVAMARACGFSSVYAFDELALWRKNLRQIIDEPGPTFALVKVAPMWEKRGPKSPGPGQPRAEQFRLALAKSSS